MPERQTDHVIKRQAGASKTDIKLERVYLNKFTLPNSLSIQPILVLGILQFTFTNYAIDKKEPCTKKLQIAEKSTPTFKFIATIQRY